MPPYQPPHLRNRSSMGQSSFQAFEGGKSIDPIPQNAMSANPPHSSQLPQNRPGPSMRSWCGTVPPQSSRNVLASPANDMRPSTRSDLHARPKKAEDDMEFIQSVSRSGGDGAEGDALKDWALQERYRKYIDQRLDKHYTSFPGPRDRPPTAGATDRLESLSSIVLLFRKLREGVVASGRINGFAIEVFESSAATAILARNIPQVISSLSGLVPGLYRAVDALQPALPSTDTSDSLAGRLSSLQLGPTQSLRPPGNRGRFATLLLLFHLCHSDSPSAYHTTLLDLTQARAPSLRSPTPPSTYQTPAAPLAPVPLLDPQSAALHYPRKLHAILSVSQFDPISFWRILADPGISGLDRTIISWASDRVRERAWDVMRKSYLEVDVEWASAWLGVDEGEVGDLAKAKGLRVEGRRIKLR